MSRKLNYDKEHINANLTPVVDSYLGARVRGEGNRSVYSCPRCGAEEFKLNPDYNGAPIIGCFKARCDADQVMDTIDFIAFMERLEARSDFERICDTALEIIPQPPGAEDGRKNGSTNAEHGPTNPTGAGSEDGRSAAVSSPSAHTSGSSANTDSPDNAHSGMNTREYRQLRHEAYKRLLELCPLNSAAYKFLYDRGCTDNTILDGRFGFFRADKGQEVVNKLCVEFRNKIMEVPGFSKNYEQKKPNFTLMGNDWILIPYFDREGYITNIEGRIMPAQEKQVKQKYKALKNSGSHAYLFPEMKWEDIEAFCEGIFGAIIAAQEGVAVASIQGYQRYRKSGGRDVLEELLGLDFARREISYIPDIDDPPQEDVMNRAPEAAHWLIERQNGVPTIATLPEGKDLDEYLLSLPKTSGPKAIRTLVSNAESIEVFNRRRQKQKQSGLVDNNTGQQLQHHDETPAEVQETNEKTNNLIPNAEVTEDGDAKTGASQQQPIDEQPIPARLRQIDRNGKASPSKGEHMADTNSPAAPGAPDYPAAAAQPKNTSPSRQSRVGGALKVLAGTEQTATNAATAANENREPTADEVVWCLRHRARVVLRVLFVLILASLLLAPTSSIVGAAGLTGLIALPVTIALAAAVPLAIIYYARRRRRNYDRFIQGKWIPGEKK